MPTFADLESKLVRIWVVATAPWQPTAPTDIPASGIAVALADTNCLTPSQAADYVIGFNGEMIAKRINYWAIACPVRPNWSGDLAPGQDWNRETS